MHGFARLAVSASALVFAAACTAPGRGLRTEVDAASPKPMVAPGPAKRLDLAGGWKYLPYSGEGDMAATSIDDNAWPVMSLPTSWFLLGSKDYPAKATALPPSFGNNAPGELWPVDPSQGFDYSGTVWYRRTVDWDGDGTRPVIFDLDMVDYYAEVFVNGARVGKHEGYFQRWSVDATRAMRKGPNVLAIKVSAPNLAFDMAQQFPVSWPKMQNQIKGIFAYHDTRPGATSWRGQERSTGGVLRGLSLRESSGFDLSELSVTPLDVSDKSARLVVEATVQNWTQSTKPITVDGVVRAKNFNDSRTFPVRFTVNATPGVSRAKAEIKVDQPQLWWSWDYGTPNLYEMTAEIYDRSQSLDRKATRFGIRSITRDDGWTVRLNGQRIYPRGSNYIATQWLSQADRAFYERDLKLLAAANLNAVRVHAHLERQEFYDVADELGIMVWQDFPLQWGYTDMPAFHQEALRQAEDMIRQYHAHPSIVLWCMHNESPHAMTWMKTRTEKQNLALDESLTALAKKLDPSRIVHRDSGTGDGHYYYGWYDGKAGDIATAEVLPMITEYGAAALPSLETLRTMFDAQTLWPKTPKEWEAWQFADFQPKNTFGLAKIEQGKNIGEFVQNTQRYQANLVRYTTELFRRTKWTKNTGVYHFMFVDDWPSVTWSVVDYYRRPKLAYGALRDSMAIVLPSIEYDIHDWKKPVAVHVVNDRLAPIAGARVVWDVKQGTKRIGGGEKKLDIPADVALKIADLGVVPALAKADGRIELRIEDGAGKEIAKADLGREHFIERHGQ